MDQLTLSVQDVAKQLGLSNAGASRLVAKRLLPATFMPPNRCIVLPASLQAYIAAGAKDAGLPESGTRSVAINNDLGWFPAYSQAAAFEQQLLDACDDQTLSAAQVDSLFSQRDAQLAGAADVQLKVTPAVQAVLSQPAKGLFTPAGSVPPFASMLELYLVQKLRDMAYQVQAPARDGQPAKALPNYSSMGLLQRLYATPEQFDVMLGASVAQLSQRRLVFSEVRRVSSADGLGAQYRISYLLPVSSFASSATMSAAAAKAF